MSVELGNDEGSLIYQLKAILYFGVLLFIFIIIFFLMNFIYLKKPFDSYNS